MYPRTKWSRASILLAAALFAACKAAPAPSVGFADPALMKNDPNIPYNRFWRKEGLDLRTYDQIYIADVDTSYMLKMTDWQKGDRKSDIEKDVHTVAVYARASLMKALREDP